MNQYIAALASASLLIVACGNTVTTTSTGSGGDNATTATGTASTSSSPTSSSTSSLTTANSTGTGSTGNQPGCSTSADCNGKPCVDLTPGGYRVCLDFPDPVTSCGSGSSQGDQCCSSSDCKKGESCYDSQTLPQCGGVFIASNLCVQDDCAQDSDCFLDDGPTEICAPAGAFGYPGRRCVVAYCHTNADCNANKGGGQCEPVYNGCCNKPSPYGLACIYPDNGCEQDSDCGSAGGKHCAIENGNGVCEDGGTECPA